MQAPDGYLLQHSFMSAAVVHAVGDFQHKAPVGVL